MTKYLIDTNIIIEHFRKNPKASDLLLKELNIVISYVTVGELLQGARNANEIKKIEKLINLYEQNLGSTGITKLALKLLKTYQPKYGLKLMDSLIAATALNTNATLVTTNVKDFKFIKDIRLQKL